MTYRKLSERYVANAAKTYPLASGIPRANLLSFLDAVMERASVQMLNGRSVVMESGPLRRMWVEGRAGKNGAITYGVECEHASPSCPGVRTADTKQFLGRVRSMRDNNFQYVIG